MARARKRVLSTSSSDNGSMGSASSENPSPQASFVSQPATSSSNAINMDAAQQPKDSRPLESRSEADGGLEASMQKLRSEPYVTNDESDRRHELAQAISSSRNATGQAAENTIVHEDHEHDSEQPPGPSHNDRFLKKGAVTLNNTPRIRQWSSDIGKDGVSLDPEELKPEPRSRIAASWVKDAVLACKKNSSKVLITKARTTEIRLTYILAESIETKRYDHCS